MQPFAQAASMIVQRNAVAEEAGLREEESAHFFQIGQSSLPRRLEHPFFNVWKVQDKSNKVSHFGNTEHSGDRRQDGARERRRFEQNCTRYEIFNRTRNDEDQGGEIILLDEGWVQDDGRRV